jgi:multiple sugar transport system permease protein
VRDLSERSEQATAPRKVRRGRPRGAAYEKDRSLAAKVFMRPAVAFVLILTVFPLVFSLAMTFTNWNLLYGAPQFYGFGNWKRLFTDEVFWVAVKNTVFMTVVGTALQYVLGLALALLVLQIRWGQVAFRVLFLLPVMISPVAVGYVIGRMLFSETQGPVNDLLVRLGLSSVPWLSDPGMAPWTIILTDTWQWTSLMFILLLAGLQAIPNDVYEAAKVDGAKAWQVFFHITFPLLAPVTVTAILIRSLELFKLVDIVRVMTGGGPGNATETATLVVYKLALENGDVAYGSTVGFALLITMIIFSLIYLAVTRSFVRRAT